MGIWAVGWRKRHDGFCGGAECGGGSGTGSVFDGAGCKSGGTGSVFGRAICEQDRKLYGLHRHACDLRCQRFQRIYL